MNVLALFVHLCVSLRMNFLISANILSMYINFVYHYYFDIIFLSQYNGANIQLLDLPGIIEGASQGKGRGRQVISVARTADVVLMMLDATKGDIQRWVWSV